MRVDTGSLQDLAPAERKELARALLTELNATEKSEAVQNQDKEAATVKRQRAFESDESERSAADYKTDDRQEESAPKGADFSQEQAPRTHRREFLEQRLQRRAGRSAAMPDGAAADGTDFSRSAPATAAVRNAADKISEMVCRDARRYDGAFEKF